MPLWLRAAVHQVEERNGFVRLRLCLRPREGCADAWRYPLSLPAQRESANPAECGEMQIGISCNINHLSFSLHLSEILSQPQIINLHVLREAGRGGEGGGGD